MPMLARSAQFTVRTLPLVEAEPHRRPLRMPNEDGYRRTCIPLHCGPWVSRLGRAKSSGFASFEFSQ
ncbi:hypothetical protein ACKLNR_008310 [Fusarium oxysporum f. sp. zingiberi]